MKKYIYKSTVDRRPINPVSDLFSSLLAVEVIFVTAGRDDVLALGQIGEGALSIIGAMNKMADEMSFDCDTCEYTDVCGDVAELQAMRGDLQRKEAASGA